MGAAWANWRLSRFAAAAAGYQKVEGSTARMWRAHSQAAAGMWAEAAAAYEDRLANVAPVYWAPVSFPGFDTGDAADKIILHWRRVARENPGSAVATWLLGNAYTFGGRADDAKAAYVEAVRLSPTWGPAIVSLAMTEANAGGAQTAIEKLDRFLEGHPTHVAALWARAATKSKNRDAPGATEDYTRLIGILAHRANSELLIEAALVAWIADRTDEGIAHLNAASLWAGEYLVYTLGTSSEEVLGSFISERTAGPAASPLGRYAYASALFGRVTTILSSDMFTAMMQSSDLGQANRPTSDDEAEDAALAEQATSQMDPITAGMAKGFRSGIMPHLGRCIRELQAALAERPDFDAAKAMLAQVYLLRDQNDAARPLLTELLAQHPDATTVRLALAAMSPMDKALDFADGVAVGDAKQYRVMKYRARLDFDSGNAKSCIVRTIAILREHGFSWDNVELLGLALDATGDHTSALTFLEHSAKSDCTGAGGLALARLRGNLAKPGVTEALIDAWRASANGSTDRNTAEDMLRRRETARYVCGGCGGRGTISVTSGSTGEYGSVSTRQDACPQCWGLGLWHTKAR